METNFKHDPTDSAEKLETEDEHVPLARLGEMFKQIQQERHMSERIRMRALQNLETLDKTPDYVAPMGQFLTKWKKAAPYYMFFTTVLKIPETRTQPLSVTFPELLDRSIGDIVQSLHTTMLVDLDWMWNQYKLAAQRGKKRVTVLYGIEPKVQSAPQNIRAHQVECPTHGSHHAAISIFQYRDSAIRIIVSSCNLYRDDWEFRTQGLWMSPHLPRMDNSAGTTDGESPTGFKRDFLHFLERYGSRMKHWRELVSLADCSAINVAFVGSVPGFYHIDDTEWGHQKLGKLLHEHMVIPKNEPRMSIVVQASSIASSSPNYKEWIRNQLLVAMDVEKKSSVHENKNLDGDAPVFKLIFPTIGEYNQSIDKSQSSRCSSNDERPAQRWIEKHMQIWKADELSRTRAMPRIKTFTRLSADNKRISFFVLGSGNPNEAAWGKRKLGNYQILNYEASVVFIPKFVTGENDFSVCKDSTRSWPTFPLPYDLPLTRYSRTSKPFFNHDIFSSEQTRSASSMNY